MTQSGTPDSIRLKLGEIYQMAKRLNDMSDEASAVIRQVETFLSQECSIGISVLTPLVDTLLKKRYLVYQKINGKYCIGVEQIDPATNDSVVQYWEQTGLEVRLYIAERLPDLITKIYEVAEERIRQAKRGVRIAQEVKEIIETSGTSSSIDGIDTRTAMDI